MAARRMTPGEWFGIADQFSWTGHLIVSHANTTGHHLAFPQVVCRAFAAEAYLKCLLALHNKAFPNDHNLRKLFARLPEEDQVAIKEAWSMKTLPNVLRAGERPPPDVTVPRTFEQCLKKSAEAFTEWRYNVRSTRYWWLGSFPDDVRNRVLVIRPRWRTTPPGPLPVEQKP